MSIASPSFVSRPLSLVPRLSSRVRRPSVFGHRPSLAPRPAHAGFTYIALLAALIIIGISLGAAAQYWSNVSLREKEKELLFRGNQYRQAIEQYTHTIPGRTEFPQSMDDLLRDNRTAVMRRHLRRKFKDPISGEDFVEIRDPLTKRIMGVNSPSDKAPLKQANFPEQYQEFEGKQKYSDWKFVYLPKPGQVPPPPIKGRVPVTPLPAVK